MLGDSFRKLPFWILLVRSSGVPVACPDSWPSHSSVNTYIQLCHLTISNHQGTSSCPPATLDLQCRRMKTSFKTCIHQMASTKWLGNFLIYHQTKRYTICSGQIKHLFALT